MNVGDIVKLRPNFRRMISNVNEQCSSIGTVIHVNGIGNIDIMLSSAEILTGVMLGNVEKVNESR